MMHMADVQAQLLLDRLELLRLRTLLVGALGMLGLVAGLVASAGFANSLLKGLLQGLAPGAAGLHVPANMFQLPAQWEWTRAPVLLQLAFAAIGIGGIVQMTRQVLSAVQVRLWFAVLLGLAAGIAYTQADLGSVWHPSQRELVEAVQAKEWARVEQLSATSKNPLAHAYVMAQVGLVKPDAGLLQLHGKTLIDQVDDTLMHRGQDREARDFQLLSATSEFRPQILSALDVAIYGAPHTEIGLRLAQAEPSAKASQGVWALAPSLLGFGVAAAGIAAAFALLGLWRRMRSRLHRLRLWIPAAA